jgi:hypothetical protein
MVGSSDVLGNWREADRASRERMRAVAERIRAEGVGDVTLPDGWTVSATLAHIGVWDSLTAARWRGARTSGRHAPDELPPGIVDFVNAGTLPLLGTLPIQTALAFAERGARELEEVLAETPHEALLEAYRLGRQNLVDRSRHRAEHLDAIEAALASRR